MNTLALSPEEYDADTSGLLDYYGDDGLGPINPQLPADHIWVVLIHGTDDDEIIEYIDGIFTTYPNACAYADETNRFNWAWYGNLDQRATVTYEPLDRKFEA